MVGQSPMVRKDRLEYREGLQVSFWNECDLRIGRVANLVLGFYRQVLLSLPVSARRCSQIGSKMIEMPMARQPISLKEIALV